MFEYKDGKLISVQSGNIFSTFAMLINSDGKVSCCGSRGTIEKKHQELNRCVSVFKEQRVFICFDSIDAVSCNKINKILSDVDYAKQVFQSELSKIEK